MNYPGATSFTVPRYTPTPTADQERRQDVEPYGGDLQGAINDEQWSAVVELMEIKKPWSGEMVDLPYGGDLVRAWTDNKAIDIIKKLLETGYPSINHVPIDEARRMKENIQALERSKSASRRGSRRSRRSQRDRKISTETTHP